jgi:UDP-GlcNAc:undecaprenyl-phosphate GlcNAc-1-phosphate transferase
MSNPFSNCIVDDQLVFLYIPFIAVLFYYVSIKLFVVIIKISVKRNIVLDTVDRSSHKGWCTNLGGVAIFSTLIFSLSFFGALTQSGFDFRLFRSFFAAITILFFIGLKDDLISIANQKKILGQLCAFGIVIFLSDTRFFSLEGIFGIHQLSYFQSIVLSMFAYFFIVNAYNLSDGIDGLAGSISVLANLFFGCFFYFHNQLGQSVIAFTLVGILFAFLKFNFSNRFKVIMGDSGSLVLGFILAFQFFNFLAFNSSLLHTNTIDRSFLYLFVLFSYPIVDTTRVFFIRIKQGRSPFSADKNHLHHALLAKGLSHRQATQTILIVTLVLLALAYAVRGLSINLGLPSLIVTAYVFYTRVSLYRFPLFTQKEIIQ